MKKANKVKTKKKEHTANIAWLCTGTKCGGVKPVLHAYVHEHVYATTPTNSKENYHWIRKWF